MKNIFTPTNYIKLGNNNKESIDISLNEKGFVIKLEFNDLPYGENALSK